jgi:hypothetical protein
MPKFIIPILLLLTLGTAVQAEGIRLKSDAPDRYTVVKGDTLWGIAGRYLDHPWQWPQIWRLNRDQIKNPHLIYPGDVLALDRSGATPRLVVLAKEGDRPMVKIGPHIRAEQAKPKAIPAIPPAAIEPFLSQPLVIEQDFLAAAPRIVATDEDRFMLGAGDVAYVTGLPHDKGVRWQIYRQGSALVDPETKQTLGYEAIYLGEAKVLRTGEVSSVQIVKSNQEIHRGDRLMPLAALSFLEYVPHAPEQPIAARIISAYGGVSEAGQNSIVALNRGSADGLEVGHVLALMRGDKTVSHEDDLDVFGRDSKRDTAAGLKLPSERYGLALVFRTFDRVSYAIVMETTRPVHVLDLLQSP